MFIDRQNIQMFSTQRSNGFNSNTEYNQHKYTMLKSIYENGGFYIGRYEAGTNTPRYLGSDEIVSAKLQRDLYPYNFVTCKQAQEIASDMATGGKMSSLMFGIQWDLVLKYIEEKGSTLAETKEERQTKLKATSSDWGNYEDISFIIDRGKYTLQPTAVGSWTKVESSYTKPASVALLTTGATDRNSVLKIYDLAGNVSEWTLERSSTGKYPQSFRGGGAYAGSGSNYPAAYHPYNNSIKSTYIIGFRPALW